MNFRSLTSPATARGRWLVLALATAAAGVFLNRSLIVYPGWETTALEAIQPAGGHAFRASTHHGELSLRFGPPLAEIWEDGRPLGGPFSCPLTQVQERGQGRGVFWNSTAYFSASDNSDPRTNGRRYAIRHPRIVEDRIAWAIYGAAAAAFLAASLSAPNLRQWPRLIRARAARSPFWISAGAIAGIFLATRLPFFTAFPVVGFSADTGGYLDLVQAVRTGHWPLFVTRTPGYPLLVWAATLPADRWLPVILCQAAISLAAGIFLLGAVFRLRRDLIVPAAVAIGGFLGSSQVLLYETSAMSDSLYTSGLLVVAGCAIRAFASPRPARLAALSAAMAGVILVRPSGMYFIVIYAALLLYLGWNRIRPDAWVACAVPFPSLLLTLSTYNYLTLGQFVISPFGEANLAGATVLFWEPDPILPKPVNQALAGLPASYRHAGLSDADLGLLRASWNPIPLYDLFTRAYNPLSYSEGWAFGNRFHLGSYSQSRALLRAVSAVAIRRHPDLYLKFVWANLAYFFVAIDYKFEFYGRLTERVRALYLASDPGFDRSGTKEYRQGPAPEDLQISGRGDGAVVAVHWPIAARVHRLWQFWHWVLFQNFGWLLVYIGVTAASCVQLLRHRFRHDGAFLLLFFSLQVAGASLVTCLVETALERYSYPTEFIYYLFAALLPLLWQRNLTAPPFHGGPDVVRTKLPAA